MTRGREFPEADCAHVSRGVDTEEFRMRMRFHQSWYRHHVLGVEPGPNPHAGGTIYGNLLLEADGDAGKNFLSGAIFGHALDRFPRALGRETTGRLYDNLLGSQTMCFNLFGSLKSDLQLATRLFRLLPGVPSDATVTSLSFEYAPNKTEHLNDATAFDAFVEYERLGAVRGFIGVETKLTEPFSQKAYSFEERYATWMRGHPAEWWWSPESEKEFSDKEYNQLWRNHLLVFAVLHQSVPAFSEGTCAVVYPSGDKQCGHAVRAYRKLLLPAGEATLVEWPLELLYDSWSAGLASDPQREWLERFHSRYLDLAASESAWQAFRGSMQGLSVDEPRTAPRDVDAEA